MKIQKKCLEVCFLALKETELSLADSRVRDAFLNKLNEAIKTLYTERVAVMEKFCTKKEDGTPDLNDKGEYHFTPDVVEEFAKELETLINEEIEVSGEKEKIATIITETKYKPKFGEVELIDLLLA